MLVSTAAADDRCACVEAAKNELLRTVARIAPSVLRDLANVVLGDERALIAWADRANLNAPWVLIVARNTLDLWRAWPASRGSRWDANHDEVGELLPTSGRNP